MNTMMRKLVVAALGCGICSAQAYDLHIKTLTPITESRTPAGEAMTFYEDGEPQFAIVAWQENQGRGKLGNSHQSIIPAVRYLTTAFEKCFGKAPEVFKPSQTNEIAKYRYRLLVGDQPATRELGIDWTRIPDQGFVIRTFEKGLVIVGHDSILDPDYNRKPLDKNGASLGTMYGALDFTERFLGVRYYYIGDDGTIYPQQKDLTVAPVAYEDAPVFVMRGTPYSIFMPVGNEKRKEALAKYMPGKLDTSVTATWRVGGTLSTRHNHTPEPLSFTKGMTDEEKRKVFYTSPSGQFFHNPGGHFGNYFDVINLEGHFADIYAQAVKDYVASDGKVNPRNLGSMVNSTCVTYSQCDTMLVAADFMDDPVVKELGLVTPADIAFAKEESRALMRNICGRMHQYLARKLAEAAPNRTIAFSAYYNTLWAPTDPRWRFPEGVDIDVEVCDGSLATFPYSKHVIRRSQTLFGDWSAAMNGKPVSTAYLYNPGDAFMRSVFGEYVGQIVKVLGPRLGRNHINVDCGVIYPIFYSYYVLNRSQWNPAFDAAAAVDESFDLCCGPKVGAHMKDFHNYVRAMTMRWQTETEDYPKPKVTVADIDAMEGFLAKARAATVPGTVEARRFELMASYWPDKFDRLRKIAGYKHPHYNVTRVAADAVTVDGRADESVWKDAPSFRFFNVETGAPAYVPSTLKLAWDEKGLYGFFETIDPPVDAPAGKDIWAGDVTEMFVSQGETMEVWNQVAVDTLNRVWSQRKRELPIPQPADVQWNVAERGFKSAVTKDAKSWRIEFFAPFAMFADPAAPKKGDTWRFFFVKDRSDEPRVPDGTALVIQANSNVAQYDFIHFE